MTEGTPAPATDRLPSVGPLGLAVLPDVLWAPSRAFRRLRAEPRWAGPFLAALLLVGFGAWIALTVTLEFSQESAEGMMERMGLSEADRAEALAGMPEPDDRSLKVLLLQVGGSVVGLAIAGLLGAGILHLIAKIAGRGPAFRHTLALFAAAFVVTGLGSAVKNALMAASGSVEVTLGPGPLFGDLPFHSLPAILLDQLDVFSLWNLALLTIGAGVTYGISRGAAFGITGTYWLLKAAVAGGWRLLMAWMAGAS